MLIKSAQPACLVFACPVIDFCLFQTYFSLVIKGFQIYVPLVDAIGLCFSKRQIFILSVSIAFSSCIALV
jgi:hypothetical protein